MKVTIRCKDSSLNATYNFESLDQVHELCDAAMLGEGVGLDINGVEITYPGRSITSVEVKVN